MSSPTEKAPRGCLSKPITIPSSPEPELRAWEAFNSRLPPVAQPLKIEVKGIPVRPRNLMMLSG